MIKFVMIEAVIAGLFCLTASAEPVWIDTDPACGLGATSDVDDCWALLLAIGSSELEIRGISTIFGNSDGNRSYERARDLVGKLVSPQSGPKVYEGAHAKLSPQDPRTTEASRALVQTLEREQLTIIALGPVTNIATVLLERPELATQIRQVIAVAGKRPSPGLGFYPGRSRILHLHDLNFRKDVEAFDVLLRSGVPTVLVPYEVASKVIIVPQDLDELAKAGGVALWLSNLSQDWMSFWRKSLKTGGFYPFDSLAVGYAVMPEYFRCEILPALIERKRARFIESRDNLVVSKKLNNESLVTYCYDVDPRFKSTLLTRLLAARFH